MNLPIPLSHIKAQVDERILTITIARPSASNALHPPACAELGQVLDWYEANSDAVVCIITGEGDKAFSAGFDLRYADAHPELYENPLFASEIVRRAQRSKPLIAAVNGVAVGLGFELALACDLIVAAAHASFGLPEPRVGLAAMGGGVVRLSRQIGLKKALGLILTGRIVSAQEGYEAGFINEIATGNVLDCARKWAAQIAECAPLAVKASLQMAYGNFELPDLATALDPHSYTAALEVLASDDASEGRHAFIERRKPKWTGR